MGFMTLEDFRDSIRHQIDAPGMRRKRLDRWVNQAYFEVVAKGRFKTTMKNDVLTTVDGTRTYALPARTLSVFALIDTDNKRRLLQTSLEDILLRDHQTTTKSKPRYWADDGTSIYLSPTPDGAYSLTRYVQQEPTALATAQETTVLPNDVDVIVEYMANYYALQALGRLQEAGRFFSKSLEMLRSRQTAEERDYEGPTNDRTEVARSEADLTEWRG